MALQHLRASTADKRPTPGAMADGQLAMNTNLASPGLFFKDSNGDLVKVGPVHIGTTAPNATPASGGQAGNSKGEQWLDTSGANPVLKIWDGSTWQSEAGEFVNASGDTMTGALVMDNQQQVRFREASGNGTNFIALQAPASVASDKTITLPDVTGTVVTTGDTGSVTSTMILDGTIVNADINASAAIADTKLATIATAGKVSNSATTAASANTASAIVARDASGNFSAGTITANLTGTASAIADNTVTSAKIVDGTIVNADINASAGIVDTKLATIATAGKVSNSATTATSTNTNSAIVARDASGDFSAGTITAALTGAASANVLKAGDTMTGVLAVTAGTAALPAITPSGDPNTGIYSPGADQLAISTNGTGRLFVDASGNIGAGDNSPGARLYVVQAAASTAFAQHTDGVTIRGSSGVVNRFSSLNFGGTGYAGDVANIAGLTSTLGTSYSNSAGAILFATKGAADSASVERMRLTSAGLLGLGTSSPNELLEVTGNIHMSGAANRTIFNRANNALSLGTNNTARLHITNAGNVGIGDNLPDSTLTIKAATSVVPLRVSGPSSEFCRVDTSGRLLVGTSTARAVGTGNFHIQSEGSGTLAGISTTRNDNNNAGSNIRLVKTRGTTAGSATVVQSGDSLGAIGWWGTDGTNAVEAASISANVDGTPDANDMPGRLVFSVTLDGAASPTEALRITNDRVVAYNQAAPAAVNATATLTVDNLKNGIITSTTAAAVTMTLPTGTLTEGGFSGVYTNMTFEWSVINTGATNAVTVQGGTGHTLVGSGAVAAGTSGRFASRRTAANTFVSYRLS
jgi:hypothetical protein